MAATTTTTLPPPPGTRSLTEMYGEDDDEEDVGEDARSDAASDDMFQDHEDEADVGEDSRSLALFYDGTGSFDGEDHDDADLPDDVFAQCEAERGAFVGEGADILAYIDGDQDDDNDWGMHLEHMDGDGFELLGTRDRHLSVFGTANELEIGPAADMSTEVRLSPMPSRLVVSPCTTQYLSNDSIEDIPTTTRSRDYSFDLPNVRVGHAGRAFRRSRSDRLPSMTSGQDESSVDDIIFGVLTQGNPDDTMNADSMNEHAVL